MSESATPVVEMSVEEVFALANETDTQQNVLRQQQSELKKQLDALSEKMMHAIASIQGKNPFVASLLLEKFATKKPGRPKGSGKAATEAENPEYDEVEV